MPGEPERARGWRRPPPSAARIIRGALLLGSVLGSACAGPVRPGATAGAEERLELAINDSDVWAWLLTLEGRALNGTRLQACTLEVRGESQPATVVGDRFSGQVHLRSGSNPVSGTCRTDRGRTLRSSVIRLRAMLPDEPAAEVQLTRVGQRLTLDGSRSRPSPGSRARITKYEWWLRSGTPGATHRSALGEGPRVAAALPGADGTHVYELIVTDAEGRSGVSRVALSTRAGTVVSEGAGHEPSWLAGAVFYGVIPPLFGTPPLDAVTARLAELSELGVTALWLSPLFGAPEGDFGYAVTDYLRVRRDYGTEEDLAELVHGAHQQGLRVVLDLVPNHTSAQHRYFRAAEALGERSHYYSFFERDARGEPTHYFDWTHLPNLDYDIEEVQAWMEEVAAHWVRRFEVDGYRVDAAWGIRQRAPEYWPRWTARLRELQPELALIAEAPARDPYYVTSGFDGAYDWGKDLGQWAWREVFDPRPGIVGRLHDAVVLTARATPRPDRVFRFLNNNDTGARFISRHGLDMTRVATAALMTLPGIPCLYSFDEVGAEFEPYAELRPLTLPPGRRELWRWHAQLVRLRRTTPALQGAEWTPLLVDRARELLVYERRGGAGELAIVALNFSAEPRHAQVSVPDSGAAPTRWRDALSDLVLAASTGTIELDLEPWGVRVLVPAKRVTGSGADAVRQPQGPGP